MVNAEREHRFLVEKGASKPATIKDVAIRAKVSVGTVSRIINGNATVSSELRNHVNAVIDELGYRPNANARTLRTNRTKALGIVVTDIRQPMASKMVAAASDVARAHGYAPIIGDFLNDVGSEALLLRFMRERNVDGLLLTISSDENAELIDDLKQMNVPIVLWERDAAGAFPSVRSDHRQGTCLAARHLKQRGRNSSILLVAGHEHTWTGREQVAGLREALGRDAGFDIMHTGRFDPVVLDEKLGAKPSYDAIIANVHDIPAIMGALQKRNLSCPDDIAIVSIGDDPFLEISNPPISAVRIHPEVVGRLAAKQLISNIEKKSGIALEIPLVAPEFIARNSV